MQRIVTWCKAIALHHVTIEKEVNKLDKLLT